MRRPSAPPACLPAKPLLALNARPCSLIAGIPAPAMFAHGAAGDAALPNAAVNRAAVRRGRRAHATARSRVYGAGCGPARGQLGSCSAGVPAPGPRTRVTAGALYITIGSKLFGFGRKTPIYSRRCSSYEIGYNRNKRRFLTPLVLKIQNWLKPNNINFWKPRSSKDSFYFFKDYFIDNHRC